MDFHFGNLILGSTVNHGAEIGEAFYAASQIKDGDAATWQDEWYKLARRVDAYPIFAAMPVTQATKEEIASWSSFHGNIVKGINWRWGVPMDEPSALIEANRGFTFDPAKIKVPALLLVGEGEYKSAETKRQQKLCMDNLPNPMKKLVITPSDEGGSNH